MVLCPPVMRRIGMRRVLMSDKEVNPKHYRVGRLEFYDGIMQMMGERVMTFKQAVDTWNVLRYTFRHDLKGMTNDDYLTNLKKAEWFLGKLKDQYKGTDDG
jgi:hypothetical protein